MTTTPSQRAAEFCDAMEARHGYRPRVRDGELVNGRDADRFAGWMLATEALRLPAGADADAARYRFLRRNWQFDITTDVWMWCDVDGIDDTDKLDATIDERIAAAPRHETGESA